MILLTCSAGGHLTEMRQLEPFYAQHPHFFVTFRRGDSESLAQKEKVYFIERPARNPINTIRAFVQAWNIISQEKPRMVVSTGADVTVPVCIVAKLRGIPIVHIESFCRVRTPGLTGKIVAPLAETIIYQWPALRAYYPSGLFGGSIFTFERGKKA